MIVTGKFKNLRVEYMGNKGETRQGPCNVIVIKQQNDSQQRETQRDLNGRLVKNKMNNLVGAGKRRGTREEWPTYMQIAKMGTMEDSVGNSLTTTTSGTQSRMSIRDLEAFMRAGDFVIQGNQKLGKV